MLFRSCCSGQRASSCDDEGSTWFFSSCGGILELRRGIRASSCVGPGKSNLPFEFRGSPAKTPAAELLKWKPDGIFFSNGPADPAALPYAAKAAAELIGKVPIMGICLGHQILGIACGGKTYRLKFGHHGCNHPVKNLLTGSVEITSQNHNFAIDEKSLPKTVEVTHLNLNDHTVEGLRHPDTRLGEVS